MTVDDGRIFCADGADSRGPGVVCGAADSTRAHPERTSLSRNVRVAGVRGKPVFVGLCFENVAGFFEEIGWTGYAFPQMAQIAKTLQAAIARSRAPRNTWRSTAVRERRYTNAAAVGTRTRDAGHANHSDSREPVLKCR